MLSMSNTFIVLIYRFLGVGYDLGIFRLVWRVGVTVCLGCQDGDAMGGTKGRIGECGCSGVGLIGSSVTGRVGFTMGFGFGICFDL